MYVCMYIYIYIYIHIRSRTPVRAPAEVFPQRCVHAEARRRENMVGVNMVLVIIFTRTMFTPCFHVAGPYYAILCYAILYNTKVTIT